MSWQWSDGMIRGERATRITCNRVNWGCSRLATEVHHKVHSAHWSPPPTPSLLLCLLSFTPDIAQTIYDIVWHLRVCVGGIFVHLSL